MSGRRSRDKGARLERDARDALREIGFEVVKVPLSGALPTHPGDLIVTLPDGQELIVECKGRADGFKQDYQWLDGASVLLKRADRKPWLITLRLADLPKLTGGGQ